MYCKLFIDCKDRGRILSILEQAFGEHKSVRSDHFFENFDIHIIRNKEAGKAEGNDRFLYYPTVADLDINDGYAETTDRILHIMRENNIHTVAACDYEDELKYNGFCKGELI